LSTVKKDFLIVVLIWIPFLDWNLGKLLLPGRVLCESTVTLKTLQTWLGGSGRMKRKKHLQFMLCDSRGDGTMLHYFLKSLRVGKQVLVGIIEVWDYYPGGGAGLEEMILCTSQVEFSVNSQVLQSQLFGSGRGQLVENK
jgi:hypothetical protein